MKQTNGGVLKRLAPIAVGAVLALSLWLLYGELKRYNFHDIVRGVAGYSPAAILLAAGITALSYLALTLFDTMGIRYAGVELAWPKTAFTSFLSYVFSYNVGLSVFGSSALRYRFYSAWGLDPARIARIIGFCVFSFWVGLFSMGSLTFLLSPPRAAPGLPAFLSWGRWIGLALGSVVAAYAALCAFKREGARLGGQEYRFPSLPLALGQILVGCLDWSLAGLVLYVLLPPGGPGFFPFLAIYMMAQIVGVTSHVPGGLGVFESIVMISLSGAVAGDRLLTALLVYRVAYYLAPLVLAAVGFLLAEILRERGRIADRAGIIARFAAPAVPAVLGVGTFLAGALLLFSVSAPSSVERLDGLKLFLPLGLLEFSHFTASLTGLGLLVLAEALTRRINAAWFLSCALLGAGALLSLLKGFHYEEAIAILGVLALLLPFRGQFYRRAAILTPNPGLGWMVALVAVVVSAGWLGFFSWKHVEYSNELWWQFELKAGAPRFLRAGLGVCLLLFIISARRLLKPAPDRTGLTLADCADAARGRIAVNAAASANLALLGDKYFFWSQDRRAFIMYGVSGFSTVAMGDPVGEADAFQELAWRFYEAGARSGARIVFYEVSSRHLPIYLELGLTVMKTGEEASVPLADFSLEGGKRAKLRTPFNKLRREGYTFRVLDAEGFAALLPELEAISASWLKAKGAKEKGFSLDRFKTDYLRNFPCAVVEKDARVHAFANVWATGTGGELAVDLMRHTPEAPNGVMEYLFANLMLWGRERGYGRFNLGIAPMSGIRESAAVPIWNRAVSLLYHAGGSLYNFEGLRRFKEKFDPDWSPVYVVSSGRFSLPAIAAEIAALVARTDG
jgi:phosphatidylglycerol lysyltransferase